MNRLLDFANRKPLLPLRIIIGAGSQTYDGWIATQREDLDLRDADCWARHFSQTKADAFLCEHVWEHLTEQEGRAAARYCFDAVKPGGYLRCAVPDALFPNAEYQKNVQIGGPGPSDHLAADHKIVYDYRLFASVFRDAGFEVDLLEYCDERGRFHYNQWSFEHGRIYRSLLSDHRNQDGVIGFVSLIIDATRPL